MKRQLLRIITTALIACGAIFAADQTWTGQITSSMCSSGHGMGHDCIMNCIKAGEKYVFVNKATIQPIQNQEFSDLEKHAGHTVKLTGAVGSDGKTITVSKVDMVSESKK